MKIRKNHIRKRYRYNVNRKRLNKSRMNTGKIKCPEVKQYWADKKLPSKNYYDMGLSTNPNKTIPVPNFRENRLKAVKVVEGLTGDDDAQETQKVKKVPHKQFVAQILENEANELREPQLRLPKGLVGQITYFMDKYKLNYKAMVNDRKNYDQWTWKQFRMKIRKFMSISEQFGAYLNSRKLDKDKFDWQEYDSDSEWK